MIAAATKALQTGDHRHYDNKQFRTFIFIIANALFHEICHLLVTFLTRGQMNTPRRMGAEIMGYDYNKTCGEAGRNLETIVHGGPLEYYRDHTHGDSQVYLRGHLWFNYNVCNLTANLHKL